jgi:hypothetical protein
MSEKTRAASLRHQITGTKELLFDLERELADVTAIAWAVVMIASQTASGRHTIIGVFSVSEEVPLVLLNPTEGEQATVVVTKQMGKKRIFEVTHAVKQLKFGDPKTGLRTLIQGVWYPVGPHLIRLSSSKEGAERELATLTE